MSIEKTEEMNALLDAYESLLTDKQQEIVSYYFREDFSLSEIAELLHISRAAVSDHIKRATSILKDYEKKLKLVEKLSNRMAIYDKMKELASPRLTQLLDELENLE